MSVHCLWRCYRVNHAGRDSNVPLFRGRQEIIVCGRVSRQRWGVVGWWKAGEWWGEGQPQRKEEALGFELAGGCHNQRSVFVMVPPSFLISVHQNYVGTDAEKNPFFLSVVLSDQNNQRVPQYRAILWRKSVSSTCAKHHNIGNNPWSPSGDDGTEKQENSEPLMFCHNAFYSIPQFITLAIPLCISHNCTGLIVASLTTFESCDQVGRKESRSINKRRVFSAHDVLILMNLLHGTNSWYTPA